MVQHAAVVDRVADRVNASLDHHFVHSTLRERIVEHVFVGEALKRLWQLGIFDVEVLRCEFDAGGYDLVMSRGSVIRHIQFKSMMAGGKAARTSVSLKLAEKQSGCVIWLIVSPDLTLKQFLWFGGAPGERLPDLSGFPVTRHSKGNAEGVKLERSNHRIVPRGSFSILSSMDAVLQELFGALDPTPLVQAH